MRQRAERRAADYDLQHHFRKAWATNHRPCWLASWRALCRPVGGWVAA